MGSNPQLGFGRVYARPEVARWLDERVARLLNDPGYTWDHFYADIKRSGITVWGAAIDTLENTSRFAKGADTGPMTVLHVFDQPLHVVRPYEGYMGTLILPREVVETAADQAILIDFRTPRAKVLLAIEETWPGIRREDIHVWTLGGKSRIPRISSLWQTWKDLGVHLVEDGWKLPTGQQAFTESGTYAPTYLVKTWKDEEGRRHLFLVDGYAASAEAVQAATLGPALGLDTSMCVFTSKFQLSYEREQRVMTLDPEAEDFPANLEALLGSPPDEATLADYRRMIAEGLDAGLPLERKVLKADDFFPEKRWHSLALSGYMCPDPYTGTPGAVEVQPGIWQVTVRLVSETAEKLVTFTLRFMEDMQEQRLVFNPLLNRFLWGEDFQQRAVKISDSGRIRNELQTLCAEALEFPGQNRIRVYFDRIPPAVISCEQQVRLLEVLRWYKSRHPFWFAWLEIVGPGASAPE
jgi:hypothetical protein